MDKNKEYPKKDLQKQSKRIVQGIEELISTMPVKETILSIKELAEEEQEYLDAINMGIENTVYMNNLHFSPNFQRNEYHLDKDLKKYVAENYRETKNTAAIKDPRIHNIVTKFDYMKNVIIPIIKNVNDHAYNPENPNSIIFSKEEEVKTINISSSDDTEKKYLTISIQDNGFGISPSVKDRMFQEGASSRKNASGHGIGLWIVKKHVEDNGGEMWFESNPGQGTTFYFTIPYEYTENGRYKGVHRIPDVSKVCR
jgi:light-regulated signal transduction histidine kinase (bacteriophytochrome)